jgi:hypothetical protein
MSGEEGIGGGGDMDDWERRKMSDGCFIKLVG